MKKIIIGLFLSLIISPVISQTNARYGRTYPTGYGSPAPIVFRIFVVFANVPDDPIDPTTLALDAVSWPEGQLPVNVNNYIDMAVSANYQSYISRYYNEISFGKLQIIGDYYPHLLQIPYNSVQGSETTTSVSVFQELNRLCGGQQLTTAKGLQFPNDFDNWNLGIGQGLLKPNVSDGYIDCIVIFWRVNSKFRNARSGGSIATGGQYSSMYISGNYYSMAISNKTGINTYGGIYCDGMSVFRHEIAHGFLGDNDFHSGGAGNGTGTYMQNYSGYSILSSNNTYMESYNAWDRYRLGWKNPQHQYEISARNETGQEMNADLDYTLQTNDVSYILRDFATTGDAVRIKLPYLRTLNSSAKEQWIWIENHQLLPGNIEYEESKYGENSPMSKIKVPRGIYLNLQVGNNDFSSFVSRTNYIAPINKFGRFDFTAYTPFIAVDGRTATMGETDDTHANPFTGVGLASSHLVDKNNNDVINTDEEYFPGPGKTKYNGVELEANYFAYQQYAVFGSVFDAYYQDDKISISTNPAPNPFYTYWCTNRGGSNIPYTTPASDDNRKIYLNGLSIRVVEQRANGDVKISIRWKDYDVENDVRWCGDIVLNEQVNLLSGNTILLDQGLTPVRPNNPITFNEQKVFASPTIFTCMQNSHFKANSESTVHLKNNSTLVAESGSEIELDGANLIVESGSTLHIKSGATLRIKGNGNILVKSDGFLCIEQGAIVILQDFNSVIKMEQDATYGISPVYQTNANCSSTITYSGDGSIINLGEDIYIQNETISNDRYYGGRNIYAGYHVTDTKPLGNVLINNNSHIIFDATENVVFAAGFECELGSSFEVKK